MPMFVLSHLPNIGKTIEHGAIENRVECIDNGGECDNQPFKVIYKQQGQKQ